MASLTQTLTYMALVLLMLTYISHVSYWKGMCVYTKIPVPQSAIEACTLAPSQTFVLHTVLALKHIHLCIIM